MEVRHRYRQAGGPGTAARSWLSRPRISRPPRASGEHAMPRRLPRGQWSAPGARSRRCEFRCGAAFTVLSQPV